MRPARDDQPSTPADEKTGPPVEVLDEDECWELLQTLPVGRVAVARISDPPLVVPVNYRLDRRVIVFRTDAGTKLFAVRKGPISFEVDFVDPFHRTGWSVLVTGVAYEATPAEIAHLTLSPWPGESKPHWVRLIPDRVTGRRVHVEPYARDARGYL